MAAHIPTLVYHTAPPKTTDFMLKTGVARLFPESIRGADRQNRSEGLPKRVARILRFKPSF
jgi:hypothetical protein